MSNIPYISIIYITYSILVTGYLLADTVFRRFRHSPMDLFLLGFSIYSYFGFLFMVTGWFPGFLSLFHGLTLLSTFYVLYRIENGQLAQFLHEVKTTPPKAWVGWGIILLLAFYFRLPVSNFIFEIGDAGAYINSANHLVRDGHKSTQFFPLNQIWCALFSSLMGKAHTALAIPYFSAAAVATCYSLSFRIFRSTWTALIAMALLATNILAMWFGRLPYSESLMTFVNLALLYLLWGYVTETDDSSRKIYLVTIPLFIGLGSLTRVTGIVWMAAFSLNLGYQLVMRNQRLNEYFIILLGSLLTYLISVGYGLIFAKHYYIEWQLKKFIPFLISPQNIIVFHAIWLAAVIIIFLLYHRTTLFDISLSKERIFKRPALYSAVSFFAIVLVGNAIIVKDFYKLFPVEFILDVFSLKLPQDAYYLYWFYGFVSFIGFPVGIVYVFKKYNPIKNPDLATQWFFGILFFIIYYSRIGHHKVHAVYLYYLRYFLSEISIIFLFVLCVFIHYGSRWKTKLSLLPIIFMVWYFTHSAIWISKNWNDAYLENAYQMLAEIEAVIPKNNSVIFTDVDYEGKWVYPQFNACFLLPLRNSFGYHIIGGSKSDNPYFVPFQKNSLYRQISNPDNPKTAYILSISRKGDRLSPDFTGMPGVITDHIKRVKTYIKIKTHHPRGIFLQTFSRHDITIDIWAVKKFFYFMYRDQRVKLTGFYERDIWTKGDGKIWGFNYPVRPEDRYIVLGTYGYNPLRNDLPKLQLKVRVNQLPVAYSHHKDNKYYFRLPNDMDVYNNIQISSSLFVPKDFHINNSEKKLGMDVKYLAIE